MKSNFTLLFSLVLILFFALPKMLMAQVKILAITTGTPCMDLNSSESFEFLDRSGKIKNFHWETKGDLKIVTYNIDSTQVEVQSHTESFIGKPFGKGRLYLIYGKEHNRDTVFYDIYKRFKEKSLKINIPEDKQLGDTTTFSISKIVSVNDTLNIGMDSYYWSFTPNLANQAHFYSTDSSSVTFLLDSINPTDSVFLDVGRCNLKDDFNYNFSLKSLKN